MSDQKKKNGKLFIAVAGILAVAILFVNVLQVVFCGTIVNAKIKDETQAQYLEFAHSYATTVTTELEKYFASLDFYVYSDPITNGASNAEIVKWLREHNYMRSGIFDYVAWVDTDIYYLYANMACDHNIHLYFHIFYIQRSQKNIL